MALRLSNPLKLKIPGSYELRQRLRRAVLWACLLASPFFLGLIAGWVFGIRLISLPPYRLASTSPAIRQAQTLWSSARKEQRPPSPSSVNIAPQGLAPMAERRFSNQPSHFPATKSR